MLNSPQSIAVVYASLSGSMQRLSEAVHADLMLKLPNATVDFLDMLSVNPDAFSQYEFIFMGASTYGEGDLNPFAEVFVASLSGRESEQIWAGIPFAIFGMGDSSYLHFCTAPDLLAECARAHGGEVREPMLKIDALLEDWDTQQERASAWVDSIFPDF